MTDPAALAHLTAIAVDQNKVTPGLLGFVVFAALGVATWFLIKSMNKQFRKVDFTEQPDPKAEPSHEHSDAGADREHQGTSS